MKCANAATLITSFLNEKVRSFTAKWHKRSIEDDWKNNPATQARSDFRKELADLQEPLRELAAALSLLADTKLG